MERVAPAAFVARSTVRREGVAVGAKDLQIGLLGVRGVAVYVVNLNRNAPGDWVFLVPATPTALVTALVEDVVPHSLRQLELLTPRAGVFAGLPGLYLLAVLPGVLALCRTIDNRPRRVLTPL